MIDRYQPPRRALDIEQAPGSDSNQQDNLVPEVIKVMEFSRQLGSVDGQEAPPGKQYRYLLSFATTAKEGWQYEFVYQ